MLRETFDPKQVKVNLGGLPISGFADGTFVVIERSNDLFTKVSGADGEVSRAKSNDLSGRLTLTLLQTSASNDVLDAFATADELTNSGIFPVAVTNLSGSEVVAAAFGWVMKKPNIEYGKELSNREWVIDLADLQMKVGGNAAVE